LRPLPFGIVRGALFHNLSTLRRAPAVPQDGDHRDGESAAANYIEDH
jgi:hypothetical protein